MIVCQMKKCYSIYQRTNTMEENKMSLNIEKKEDASILLEGRLDTTTAPELEKYLENEMKDAVSLTFDMEKLEYISSAGLRVLLMTQKLMNQKNGTLKLTHVNDTVQEVFEITGFTDILTIE